MTTHQIVLTGDRPTGPLHLGHYAGSLRTRLALHQSHRQYVLIADNQALTDNGHDPDRIRRNIVEVATDYLAVGLDPARTTICLQSGLPVLADLTQLYLNLVTVARLERIPTIRAEIAARGFGRAVPAGFLVYPVSQAADITAFGASLVPAGADQAPLIELANEIVQKVNRQAGRDLLPTIECLLSTAPRLPGADGAGKMSKSAGNALPLSADRTTIKAFVDSMYTDPGHLRVSDPGRVEGNVVFAYLDAFDPDQEEVAALKARYRRGGLGDVPLKRRLAGILNDLLAPIRERRGDLARRPDDVQDILRHGTEAARAATAETGAAIRAVLATQKLI